MREVPKVVGGETPLCTELAAKLFAPSSTRVVPVSSTQSAEMVKLLENTFRAINIGLANEVALMCDRLDLDVWEVIDAAATKPYGFMKFLPGPGLGGHCIPVDPTYLAWKMKSLNFPARFIELATEINGQMPEHVAGQGGRPPQRRPHRRQRRPRPDPGRGLQGRRLGHPRVAGPGRHARLLAAKGAEVRYHDPHVRELELDGTAYKSVDLSDDALASADLVVIITAHDAEVDYDRVVALRPASSTPATPPAVTPRPREDPQALAGPGAPAANLPPGGLTPRSPLNYRVADRSTSSSVGRAPRCQRGGRRL